MGWGGKRWEQTNGKRSEQKEKGRAKGQAWQGSVEMLIKHHGARRKSRERQDAGEFGVWCLCCEFTYTDFGQLMFVGNSSLKKVSSTS